MDLATGNIVTIVILAAYVVLMPFYLRAEAINDGHIGFARATAMKLTLSGMFCAVGFLTYYLFRTNSLAHDIYLNLMLLLPIALVFAMIGDHYLQYIRLDEHKYKKGIAFFMVCQILLIVMMFIRSRWSWQEFVILAAILVVMQLIMNKGHWQLGGEQKILTVYTVFLGWMTAKSITSVPVELTGNALVMMIGAVLFLVSDVFLGFWNYQTSKRIHANLNWITYFGGTMLIALSLNPTFNTYIGF